MTVFIVLSLWQNHCESSLGSRDEYSTMPSGRRQANELESQARLCRQPENCIQKADTHFTVPWRVEG